MLTVYIGADGHIYIRLFGHLLWRSAERVPQDVIDIGHRRYRNRVERK